MNTKLILAMAAALLLSPLSHANDVDKSQIRTHYTCHLMLVDDIEVVHQFVSVGETEAEFYNGLPAQTVYIEKGKRVAIETVYECITKDQRFKTEQARKLKEITPV